MDRFWLKKAHKYISEHNAFDNISEINSDATESVAVISANVRVNLPSKFIQAGITKKGVKEKEEVQFLFSNSFPLKAPIILLRDDFPRCFPHINPSKERVSPCIYEGDPSELLQQAGWMNEVLNQLVDWLEKAASNDLLDYDQGWEPMRNDRVAGFITYEMEEVLAEIAKGQSSFHTTKIEYTSQNNYIIADSKLLHAENVKKAHLVFFVNNHVVNDYIPNNIYDLSQLYDYASSIGLKSLKAYVEKIDLGNIGDDKLFVSFAIKRPVNIIGTDTDVEFLNFVITKSKPRRKKRRELKRTLPNCKVDMLSHVSPKSPALLRRLSGTKTNKKETSAIALLGCGSLGSKIGIHLARNGNEPFVCIDNDVFMSHNNARHALTFTYTESKAKLMAQSIFNIGRIVAVPVKENVIEADYSTSRMLIDTTASLSVRNFLMREGDLPPIISCGLYKKGQCGLLLIANNDKSGRLFFLWAYLYHKSLFDTDIRKVLFSRNLNNVLIGQSCSSQTMIADDAQLSIMAATMSRRIQEVLESGFPNRPEIVFSQSDGNYSLTSKKYSVPEFIKIVSADERDFDVYISQVVIDDMQNIMREKKPNETGGTLLGSVFLYPKAIVITGIIKAPPDSIETPALFVLGGDELEKKIKKTEKLTNGKVTYLGTWHSHPHGGSASHTDKGTFKKLLFVRNYEPTVCLIITERQVMMV